MPLVLLLLLLSPLILMLAMLPGIAMLASSTAERMGSEGRGKADAGGRGREGNWRSAHCRLPSHDVAAVVKETCADVEPWGCGGLLVVLVGMGGPDVAGAMLL